MKFKKRVVLVLSVLSLFSLFFVGSNEAHASKGGYRATRMLEYKLYGQKKSPSRQIWDNAKKMWRNR